MILFWKRNNIVIVKNCKRGRKWQIPKLAMMNRKHNNRRFILAPCVRIYMLMSILSLFSMVIFVYHSYRKTELTTQTQLVLQSKLTTQTQLVANLKILSPRTPHDTSQR